MKNIGKKINNIWFGVIKDIGGFIYDVQSQRGAEKDQVEIFVLSEKKNSTYIKEILKKNLLKPNENIELKYADLIADYLKINDIKTKEISIRKTNCFDCKEDLNSVDDSLCKVCNWIQCSCGACGCGWENYEIN